MKKGCLISIIVVAGAGVGIIVITIIFSAIFVNIASTDKNNNNKTAPNKELNDSLLKVRLKDIDIELPKLKRLFTEKYDDIDNVTWYRHVNQPKYSGSKAFYLYIGKRDNEIWERLVIRYYGDDWLFVRNVIVKSDELIINLNNYSFERDNNSSVWEWVDVPVTNNELGLILAVTGASKTKIRFVGDRYHSDWTLTNREVKAMKDTHRYFELLKEKITIKKQLNI